MRAPTQLKRRWHDPLPQEYARHRAPRLSGDRRHPDLPVVPARAAVHGRHGTRGRHGRLAARRQRARCRAHRRGGRRRRCRGAARRRRASARERGAPRAGARGPDRQPRQHRPGRHRARKGQRHLRRAQRPARRPAHRRARGGQQRGPLSRAARRRCAAIEGRRAATSRGTQIRSLVERRYQHRAPAIPGLWRGFYHLPAHPPPCGPDGQLARRGKGQQGHRNPRRRGPARKRLSGQAARFPRRCGAVHRLLACDGARRWTDRRAADRPDRARVDAKRQQSHRRPHRGTRDRLALFSRHGFCLFHPVLPAARRGVPRRRRAGGNGARNPDAQPADHDLSGRHVQPVDRSGERPGQQPVNDRANLPLLVTARHGGARRDR